MFYISLSHGTTYRNKDYSLIPKFLFIVMLPDSFCKIFCLSYICHWICIFVLSEEYIEGWSFQLLPLINCR